MILMNDFRAEPDEMREAMLKASKRVFESGWYVLGKEVESFEAAWASACGLPSGVGVGNGMDAIEISLRSLGVGPGDEVITTPVTAFASVLAILRSGATPILADILPHTGLMDPESVQRCLTDRTKAVLLVHLYGQVRGMDVWLELCQTAGVYLVEDCAQAHLARSGGVFAGAFGVAGAYSFYPTKNLGAVGDGGMLVTADASLADKARRLRNYGQSERYHHPDLGMNSRLDELQAALLNERLRWLPEHTSRRRQIAMRYHEEISNDCVELLAQPEELDAHAYHLFVVKTKTRTALLEHLRQCGVQSLIHYPVAIQQQPPCVGLRRDSNGLSVGEQFVDECLSLPCHPQMSGADVDQVIMAVNGFRSQ